MKLGMTSVHVQSQDLWQPRRFQEPPQTDWLIWLIEGARGVGKTRAALEYAIEHLYNYDEKAIVSIVGGNSTAARHLLQTMHQLDPALFPSRDMSQGHMSTVLGGTVSSHGITDISRIRGTYPNLLLLDGVETWGATEDVSELIRSFYSRYSSYVGGLRTRIIITKYKPVWLFLAEALSGFVRT